MITINTSLIKRGSFKEKVKNFIDNFIRPYKKDWMKRLSERIKELKDASMLENIRVLYPNDIEPSKRIGSLSNPIDKNDIIFEEVKGKWNTYTKTSFKVGEEEYPLFDGRLYYAYSILQDDCSHRYYIYAHTLDMWLDVNEFVNAEPYFTYKYRYVSVVTDEKIYYKYKAYHCLQRSIFKVSGWIYSFFHTIDSTILCIRFPFLYPRNRFTGKHYNNWRLQSLTDKYFKESTCRIGARYPLNEDEIITVNELPQIENKENPLNKKLRIYYYIDSSGNEVIVKDKAKGIQIPIRMDVNGEKTHWCYDETHGWIDITHCELYDTKLTLDSDDHKTVYFTVIIDKKVYKKSHMIDWFHRNILGNIFIIPTSNELDALDEGWKRRFGIDICKEIKKELKANNCLYSYRIEQIKEKYGSLRWYDYGGTKKIFEIIEKYENISARTCISCGEDAEYRTRGWISPFCSHCIDQKDKDYADRIVDGKVVRGDYLEEL